MFVSIIIPVHQVHLYFKNCVESALAQTHTGLEIILACNGKLTTKECQHFIAIKDDRLVFLKTENGRHNARNEALRIAKGSWIQFLDYDDYLFPDKIEQQLEFLSKNGNLKLSICQWKKFNEKIDESYTFPFKYLFDEPEIRADQLVQKLALSGGFLATASWLVSKDIISELKWIDSPNDDAVFMSEILKKSPEVSILPKVLAGYRIHDANTSSIRTKQEFDKLMLSWKIIHHNLLSFNKKEVSLYLYKAHLILISYSKQINRYRFIEVVYLCFLFGIKANIGFLVIKDIKNRLFK